MLQINDLYGPNTLVQLVYRHDTFPSRSVCCWQVFLMCIWVTKRRNTFGFSYMRTKNRQHFSLNLCTIDATTWYSSDFVWWELPFLQCFVVMLVSFWRIHNSPDNQPRYAGSDVIPIAVVGCPSMASIVFLADSVCCLWFVTKFWCQIFE